MCTNSNVVLKKIETTNNEPLIDSRTIITVTDDKQLIKEYQYYDIPSPEPPSIIEQIPQVKIINPITKKSTKSTAQEADDLITDEYYLKRHRKHEMDEKKQKNREKERLRHGYYQQKQLVERIKAMDKSLLQSIVSSIRHRTHKDQQEEESSSSSLDIEVEHAYLEELHDRLLRDALEHLKRYELLGLSNNKEIVLVEEDHIEMPALSQSSTIVTEPSQFQQALKTEAKKQRERQIKSFTGHPTFVGETRQQGARRSTRRVIAFGQKLPEFDTQEFVLPSYLFDR
jgi:hypothetical protein